jgi:hypothetical protein
MKQTIEERKEKFKAYYYLNKEKFAENARKYRNTEKGKLALERARKKERDNLSDNYIRQNLATNLYLTTGKSLDRKSVSQEHVDILRKILLAKRELKLFKYEN